MPVISAFFQLRFDFFRNFCFKDIGIGTLGFADKRGKKANRTFPRETENQVEEFSSLFHFKKLIIALAADKRGSMNRMVRITERGQILLQAVYLALNGIGLVVVRYDRNDVVRGCASKSPKSPASSIKQLMIFSAKERSPALKT